jgi:hypothetical protein
MTRTIFTSLAFAGIFSLSAIAQKTIILGKDSITVPDNPIAEYTTKYSLTKIYIELVNGSIVHLTEVSEKKGGKNEYELVRLHMFNLSSLDPSGISVNQVEVEPLEGEEYTYFITYLWINEGLYKQYKALHIYYRQQGEATVKEDLYISIYSNSKEIFNKIKSLLNL